MIIFRNIFFILFFLSASISPVKAEDKIAYLDIDYILSNTVAGKLLLNTLKKEEELNINKFKSKDEGFKIEENKILAKKNLISKEETAKDLKSLQVKFNIYRKNKIKEFEKLKAKRNRNIVNFLNLINPII